MSVTIMAAVFAANMPELKTDDGKTVPDSTSKFVLLALADHASEDGENAYIGVKRICQKTNFSTSTVCNALNALRTSGIIELVGKSKAETNNYTINISRLQSLKFQPVESGDSSRQNPPILATEVKPSVKPSVKPTLSKSQVQGIEAAMFQDRKVTESDLPISDEALKAFERDMQCPGSWSWYPAKSSDEPAWKALREFVVTLYQSDPKAFEKYYTWAKQPYSRGAMTVLGIKRNPQEFELSWAAFCASEMYSPKQADTNTEGKGFYV